MTSGPTSADKQNAVSQEIVDLIGCRCNWIVNNCLHNYNYRPTGQVLVKCRIMDARLMFGRVDLEITPLNGEGRLWVALNNVEVL
jgi:hypothetical protein